MLDIHAVRAADALQLAAALMWCRDYPKQKVFVCGDRRLGQAAKNAGFTLMEVE